MTDEHRTIRARRLAARDALGIPRSPRHGWDAVPDTRDVRPEPDEPCAGSETHRPGFACDECRPDIWPSEHL